jgi:hypothetical protein
MKFLLPGFGMKSLPKIFRWITYPVKPFGFKLVLNRLPPPLPDGIRD